RDGAASTRRGVLAALGGEGTRAVRWHEDMEVDPVEQRAAQASPVATELHRAAGALASLGVGLPAGARVGRDHHLEGARVLDARGGAPDRHPAALDRLPQRLEDAGLE